uniref:Ground-like domain-containing protein n=1 Tax=Panagrolaimus sp. JU765 TaxID=591449 RepID=A0AC34Q2X6_9BILA
MLFLVFLWIFLESIDGKCDHSERGLNETCLLIKPVMFQLRGIILKENDEIHGRFQRQSGLIDGGYDNTRPNPRKSAKNPVGFPIAIPISRKFNLTNPRFQKLRIPTTISRKNKTRIGIRGPIRQPIRLKFQPKQQGNQRSEKPGIVPPPEFNSRISKNNLKFEKQFQNNNFTATRYYYAPKLPLPLSKCFYNPSGYVCCNEELNDLMITTVETLLKKPKFNSCNIGAISIEVQKKSEERFQTRFETIAGLADFAQLIHFSDDLVCKIEIDGKIILAYATPPSDFEQITDIRIRQRRQITKIRI